MRFLSPLALLFAAASLATALPGHARPAAGFIVELHEAAPPAAARDADTAQSAQRRAAPGSDAAAPRTRFGGYAVDRERSGPTRLVLRAERPLDSQDAERERARLAADPAVRHVEPNVRIRLASAVTDPEFPRQWELQPPSAGAAAAIDAERAWARVPATDVVVAVVDTGVLPGHPELQGALLPGYDFVSADPDFGLAYANDGDGRDADPTDPGDWITPAEAARVNGAFAGCDAADSSWHGTFIAGQLGARAGNGIGTAGLLGARPRILPVRAAGKCGALLSDLLDAVRWAAGLPVAGVPANPHLARIINLSFEGDAACSPLYQRVVDEVGAQGALIVAAAGNRLPGESGGSVGRPADCRGVLAVAAAQRNGLKADYSNFGPAVGLLAPGGTAADGIWSLSNSGRTVAAQHIHAYGAGTSFAAPLAAGVAALALAADPALDPAALRALLQQQARPHVAGHPVCEPGMPGTCFCTTQACGAGLLDAGMAVAAAQAPEQPQSQDGASGGGGAASWPLLALLVLLLGKRRRLLAPATAALALLCGAPASASETLRKIQQTGTITLGHRQSSVPFSYYDSRKQVVGYAHDLSTLVSQAIRHELQLPALTTKLVPVTAQNRIPMVVSGNVDLECGSTTHNLERARQVLFSTSFFVISTRLMVHRDSGIHDFRDLAGKRVVVTSGTTSERLIRTFSESSGLKFQILTAREHEESFGTLERGQADAFMMDDALLYGERAKAQQPLDWTVVGQPMTREAYGCMMRKDDLQLKRIVDQEIARLMQTGELLALYRKWFERPITTKGLNLNWPPSQDVLELFANPNDRPLQ